MSNLVRSNTQKQSPLKALGVFGRKLPVSPDPPSINSMATLVTTVDTSFNVPANQFYTVNVTTVEGLLESQFGLAPATYSVSVSSMKVWLLEPNQKLTVQFFDVNSASGSPVQQEVTDWGAPTRYSAVGYLYALGSRTTSVSGGSGAGLGAIAHSLSAAARVMVRFNLRLKFKSLAGA